MADRASALVEDLGAQIGHLKGAGAKVVDLLAMVQLDRSAEGAPPQAEPFARVRKVIEKDSGARIRDLFDDIAEEPFALTALGQVHRACTSDGDDVAVKVQRPGAAEAVEGGLRNLGLVSPIVKQLAPGLDAGAVLAEIRERIADELDYEVQAQHQRRIERRFRGHPHVHVPRVHTDISTRRMLVTEYAHGRRADAGLPEGERDRAGEIAFRFFLGLAWRDGIVAGDPDPDNCLIGSDGRLCVLDFGLLRDRDPASVAGERDGMRALAEGDADRAMAALTELGYAPDPDAYDVVFEHLQTAGEWLIAEGFRRIDPAYVARVFEAGYPPQSPYFGTMRRLGLPAEALLMRRLEIRLLALLGALRAGADWGAIAAEHHSGRPPATDLGREDQAFFAAHHS
jgi:serine/threonine protein kinase